MTDISSGNNDNIGIIVAMKLHLLVCDGVFDLGLAALTDTVGLANAMAGSLPQAPAHIELTLVGVRRRIRTAQGGRESRTRLANCVSRPADSVPPGPPAPDCALG